MSTNDLQTLRQATAAIAQGRPFSAGVTRFENQASGNFDVFDAQIEIAPGVIVVAHEYNIDFTIRELMNEVAAHTMARAA